MPSPKNITKTASGLLSEFRRFALRGNALELAIAVVVGAAFGRIVTSLVADVITPLMAFITGGAEVRHLALTLREAAGEGSAVTLTYGTFLQHIFDFLFVALFIFLVFKLLSSARNRLFRREEAGAVPAQEKPAQERLLEEIRDLLKERK